MIGKYIHKKSLVKAFLFAFVLIFF